MLRSRAMDEPDFTDLPAGLVKEMLRRTGNLADTILHDLDGLRRDREALRERLEDEVGVGHLDELPEVPLPTACAADGAYAVDRLLGTDLVTAAAVAVEGFSPPRETRRWPEPHHRVHVLSEPHDDATPTMVRALMAQLELAMAAEAPHDLVLLDGAFHTPLLFCGQAAWRAADAPDLASTGLFLDRLEGACAALAAMVEGVPAHRAVVAVPKYTVRREVGQRIDPEGRRDDRSVLSLLLEPGEYTLPVPYADDGLPGEPGWPPSIPVGATRTAEAVVARLRLLKVVYLRPAIELPALRLEIPAPHADDEARLAAILRGVAHQSGAPAVLEPYPLYLADRMVKSLSRALPALRLGATLRVARDYGGPVADIFAALHAYRSEGGR